MLNSLRRSLSPHQLSLVLVSAAPDAAEMGSLLARLVLLICLVSLVDFAQQNTRSTE